MPTPEPFVLLPHERESALWHKLKGYLEERLKAHRSANDSPQSIELTNVLRGRIAELKHLVALDQPRPQTEADDFPDQ